jgi:hypothetical protein
MYFQSVAMKDVAKQNAALPTMFLNKKKPQARLMFFLF